MPIVIDEVVIAIEVSADQAAWLAGPGQGKVLADEASLAQVPDPDPGAGRTLHVHQLKLRLEAGWLLQNDEELVAHMARALRQAWGRLAPGALATAPRHAAGDLLLYLETGELPPVWATLAPDERARQMRRSAASAASTGDVLRLGGRAGPFDQRVAWFKRWLMLWDDKDRAHWLPQRPALPPTLSDPLATDTLERLDRLLPGLAGEARTDAQAVWMAAVSPGPVSFDPLRRAHDLAARDAALALWLARLAASA